MKLDVIPTCVKCPEIVPFGHISHGTIGAGRLMLRPVRTSDMQLFLQYAGDRRVAEATRSIPHPLLHDDVAGFIHRAMSDQVRESVWVMDGSANHLPEVIGVISLKPMDEKDFNFGQSEIGYWVAPSFWNAGFASEAVKALMAANPLENRTIFAEVFQDNPGSARVLTNAGFQYLGDAETFCRARKMHVPTWTYLRKFD